MQTVVLRLVIFETGNKNPYNLNDTTLEYFRRPLFQKVYFGVSMLQEVTNANSGVETGNF